MTNTLLKALGIKSKKEAHEVLIQSALSGDYSVRDQILENYLKKPTNEIDLCVPRGSGKTSFLIDIFSRYPDRSLLVHHRNHTHYTHYARDMGQLDKSTMKYSQNIIPENFLGFLYSRGARLKYQFLLMDELSFESSKETKELVNVLNRGKKYFSIRLHSYQ